MKILSGECANLVLRNQVILTTTGRRSTEFSVTINLRNVIGDDIYEEYDEFGICLNSIATFMLVSSFTVATTEAVCYVGMSGLPFLKTSNTGNITNFVLFPNLFSFGGSNNPALAFRTANFSNTAYKCLNFRKPKNSVVTLTLGIYPVQNQTRAMDPGNSINPLEFTTDFSFTIFGLPKEEEDKK